MIITNDHNIVTSDEPLNIINGMIFLKAIVKLYDEAVTDNTLRSETTNFFQDLLRIGIKNINDLKEEEFNFDGIITFELKDGDFINIDPIDNIFTGSIAVIINIFKVILSSRDFDKKEDLELFTEVFNLFDLPTK